MTAYCLARREIDFETEFCILFKISERRAIIANIAPYTFPISISHLLKTQDQIFRVKLLIRETEENLKIRKGCCRRRRHRPPTSSVDCPRHRRRRRSSPIFISCMAAAAAAAGALQCVQNKNDE